MKHTKKARHTWHILLVVILFSNFVLLPVSANSSSLQQEKLLVTGKIVDESMVALIGVTVAVKGTYLGTISDEKGEYSIAVNRGETLVYSSVGYKEVVVVANKETIDVVLEEDVALIDELVVTAMGVKKEKKALGYAVQDIKSTELLKNKQTNIINSLGGKISGLNVTQSGGAAGAGASIIIRGGTSLERDNQPLFVVDGIIYDNSTAIGGNSAFDGATTVNTTNSNRIMDINPEDIENVSVLKGPAASALYGSRAASGVIVITTKKGEEGAVRINLSSKLKTLWVNRLPESQNKYKRGFYNKNGVFDDFSLSSWGEAFGEEDAVYNNMENFFENGHVFDNNVSISGGTKNQKIFLSASRFDQKGIMPKTGFQKSTFRLNGEQKYGKLTLGANVSYSLAETQKTLTGSGLYNTTGIGAMGAVYSFPRSDDMMHWQNEDGTRFRMFEGKQEIAQDTDNPYWIVNRNPISDKTTRFTGALNASYQFTDWFNVSYTLGVDDYTTGTDMIIGAGGGIDLQFQRGMLSESDRTYNYLSSNLLLSFSKKIYDFDLNLLLGHAAEQTKIKTNRRKVWNFVIDEFYNINNSAAGDRLINQANSKKRLVGAFGEFRVGYKSILYGTFTGRNDWTSTLPIENRSYFYPSVSASFVFSELLPKNDVLSYGKLRASWATVGKDADPYVTNTYVNPPIPSIGGSGIIDSWAHGNPLLIPEKTVSTEFGLELGFLNGRINLDAAYYTNKSINQLLSPRTSQTTGYIFMITNAGDITNKGFEVSIKAKPVLTKNFSWNTMLNFSQNKGTVNNLLEGLEVLYVTDVQVGNAKAASFNKGLFMGISGSKYARDDDGNMILDWNTGMPTSDGLATYEIGNREPTITGGFSNSFQYKGFEFSFLLDFRIGGDIYNGTDYYMTSYGTSRRSLDRESITLSGVAKNPVSEQYESKTYTFSHDKFYIKGEEVSAGTPNAESGNFIIREYWQTHYSKESANYITNTNWLRLRSVSLSYSLSQPVISKLKFVKDVTFNLTGDNLLLFTNYKGLDPETSAAGSGAIGSSSVGIDYNGVPATAAISFGLNVTF